jgi:hypothetical protein
VDGNPTLIKNYIAEADIAAYKIVKYGTVEGKVLVNDSLEFCFAGIVNKLGGTSGYRCDVMKGGIGEVILGGTVAYGDVLVSDASGNAIKLADATADVPITIIGIAEEAGTVGAIIRINIHPQGSRAALDESSIRITDITLTTAQVLALYTTPIQVLAAPGSGKAIVLVSLTAFLDYNSAAYDGVAAGENLVLSYTNASGTGLVLVETTGFLDQASDQVRHCRPSQAIDVDLTPVANAAVVAHILTGNIATGNSPLKLRIAWRRINTAW